MSARDLPLHDLLADAAGAVSHIDPAARVESGVRMGEGCRVRSGAVIARGTRLGYGVLVGPNAVFVDDEEQVGPTSVGDGAHIGANAVVDAGLRIGARARVKPGAVVLHDVPEGAIVAGNPAIVIGQVDLSVATNP
jgi:UDP-2-acetamido-3-amino-2,3-dideoxy-glucuronate N-acetyltransferase